MRPKHHFSMRKWGVWNGKTKLPLRKSMVRNSEACTLYFATLLKNLDPISCPLSCSTVLSCQRRKNAELLKPQTSICCLSYISRAHLLILAKKLMLKKELDQRWILQKWKKHQASATVHGDKRRGYLQSLCIRRPQPDLHVEMWTWMSILEASICLDLLEHWSKFHLVFCRW